VIDSARLVTDLKKQLKLLEADLRQRADDPETPWADGLRVECRRALAGGGGVDRLVIVHSLL